MAVHRDRLGVWQKTLQGVEGRKPDVDKKREGRGRGASGSNVKLETTLGHPLRRALIQFRRILDLELLLDPGPAIIHRGGL